MSCTSKPRTSSNRICSCRRRIPNLGLIAPVYTLGWTLNYEMFFYLLFGFCLFVPSPRLRFALLALAFLLLVAGGLLAQPQGAIARTYTDPIMLEFLAGVMLAILAPLLMRCGTIARACC